MSHRRNQLRNDPSFAEKFKPAIILGGPRLEDMRNNVFLELQKERFNENRDRLLYLDTPTRLSDETRSAFSMVTNDPGINPIIHMVEVVDVKETYDKAFVVEPKTGATGISIFLIKETNNENSEIYANTYFLPFSTLSEILSDCSSEPIGVKAKQEERIKLQVTIRPSATGEPTFNTHDTEVLLHQQSEDSINEVKTRLQLETAAEVAHFVSQLIQIKPKTEITLQTQLHSGLFSTSLNLGDFWSTLSTVTTGATAICGTIAATAATLYESGAIGVAGITFVSTWGGLLAGLTSAAGGFGELWVTHKQKREVMRTGIEYTRSAGINSTTGRPTYEFTLA